MRWTDGDTMRSSPAPPPLRFVLSLERAQSDDESDNYSQKSPTPFLPFVEEEQKASPEHFSTVFF